MSEGLVRFRAVQVASTPFSDSVRVGNIKAITEDGGAVVDYPDNPGGACRARCCITASEGESDHLIGAPVLLMFEGGDPRKPVIVGMVHDTLILEEKTTDGDARREITIDGDRLVLDARTEIVLRCGRSAITLRADGKVVVKGKEVVSRASMANKIKGANVSIN